MSAPTGQVLPEADDRPPPAGENCGRSGTHLLYGTLAVIGALAAGAVLLITKHGAGMIPDSAVYIGTARNLARGRGLTTPFNLLINPYSPARAAAFDGAVPLTHYPPLFPAVLAVFERIGIDAFDAARWFNALLMGVNVFLAGVVAWRFSGGSRAAGVASAVLVAASFNVLYVHGFVVTDPLMLACFLSGFLLLERLLVVPSTTLLVGLTVCCAGAALVRYAGIALTATAVVVVLLSATLGRGDATTGRRRARRRRSRYAAVLLVGGAGPLAIWMAMLALDGSSEGARPVAVHLPGSIDFQTMFETVAGWFVGSHVADLTRVVALVGIGAIVVIVALLVARHPVRVDDAPRSSRPGPRSPLWILAVFAVAYAAVLVFSKALLDRTIPFDRRLLAPLQVTFAIVAVVLLVQVLSSRVPFAALCAVLAIVVLAWVWPWRIWFSGFGDTTTWDLIEGTPAAVPGRFEEAVARLPEGDLVVTNGPDRLYVLTGRPSILLPTRKYSISAQKNPNFDKEIAELGHVLAQHDGALVYYGVGDTGVSIPTLAELRRRLPLVLVEQFPSGSIWRLSDSRS